MTHIRDPCQFMIQRVADLEQLQIMMNVINIYCDSTENVHDLLYDVKFGMLVVFAPSITKVGAESCCCLENFWKSGYFKIVPFHTDVFVFAVVR